MGINYVDIDDYFERGKDYVILGKYEEAIEDLTKAIKNFPDDEFHCEKNFMAYFSRGVAYKKLKKYTNAMQDFEQATCYKWDSRETWDNLDICRQILFGYDDYVKYKFEVEEEQKKC